MQITPFLIYLWQLADSVLAASIPILFISLIGCALCAGLGYAEGVEAAKKAIWRLFVPLAVVATLLKVFTPSSKTIAMMVIVPGIANSKVIQTDMPELYNLAVDALKSKLKETVTEAK